MEGEGQLGMEAEGRFALAYRASRRSYEFARLRGAFQHGAMVAVLVAALTLFLFGRAALVWIPVTVLGLTFTEWRGSFVMIGARRGLLAGLASLVLPLSILRPCCAAGADAMSASCCSTMPSACWATGAVMGLAMALLLPKIRETSTTPRQNALQGAVGLVLGVVSVAVLRCSMLFLGEAVGLLGGVAAGVLATTAARVWLTRGRSFG